MKSVLRFITSAGLSRLPPHGGSGLKYNIFIDIIKRVVCLPPHGGSGLKSEATGTNEEAITSPSAWREWIEISISIPAGDTVTVSLRMEGVD